MYHFDCIQKKWGSKSHNALNKYLTMHNHNRNVAFWDMGLGHCGICAVGLIFPLQTMMSIWWRFPFLFRLYLFIYYVFQYDWPILFDSGHFCLYFKQQVTVLRKYKPMYCTFLKYAHSFDEPCPVSFSHIMSCWCPHEVIFLIFFKLVSLALRQSWLRQSQDYLVSSIVIRGMWHTLKRKCCNFDEIFITGCTESCHFDNFQCSQWWKFRQNYNIFVLADGYYQSIANNKKHYKMLTVCIIIGMHFHSVGLNTFRPIQKWPP